ncbi:MAG: DUF523 domain-containing protein, partial [Leptolinea sp.]|nr:DUF523 domain-containing protein [Leptolinea sp.]
RLPCEIINRRVVRQDSVDVTAEFECGARDALSLVRLANAREAILKARSPSCGAGLIYDGTFSHTVTRGDGIFAALCRAEGISLKTEEDL